MEQYSIWNKTDCQILSNPVLKTFFGAAKPLPYAGGLDFEARIMGLLQRLIFFLNQ
jgi:hypothetical protein